MLGQGRPQTLDPDAMVGVPWTLLALAICKVPLLGAAQRCRRWSYGELFKFVPLQ